jgi:hypothetical protein
MHTNARKARMPGTARNKFIIELEAPRQPEAAGGSTRFHCTEQPASQHGCNTAAALQVQGLWLGRQGFDIAHFGKGPVSQVSVSSFLAQGSLPFSMGFRRTPQIKWAVFRDSEFAKLSQRFAYSKLVVANNVCMIYHVCTYAGLADAYAYANFNSTGSFVSPSCFCSCKRVVLCHPRVFSNLP